MLSAGDVQGCLRKLETLLRVIKFPGIVDYSGLSQGDPSAVLPILSFTLTSFSPPFAEQLMAAGLEVTGKTDLRFTDTLYKILRDIFNYKPILSKQQFLQWGFSQRKISTTCDIINLVVKRHSQLKKPKVKCPTARKENRDAHPPLPNPELVSDTPFVVNHIQHISPKNLSHEEALSQAPSDGLFSVYPEDRTIESPGGQEDKNNVPHSPEVEARLLALEAQLEKALLGLGRISVLEKRLEELERHSYTEKNEREMKERVTISRESWENLTSRVLLLETKLELGSAQSQPSAPPLCHSLSSSYSSSVAMKEDLKERLERITNMLKSTSSLIKCPDSQRAFIDLD